ncbi:cytochrome c1-like [Alosa alosa]|uniref:cytochrome c1-like n=1 Tax=Alosa alosa TaxID=278164 RepID=UPI002015108B|nr:cytochrome c1-like [Alosa alosa]
MKPDEVSPASEEPMEEQGEEHVTTPLEQEAEHLAQGEGHITNKEVSKPQGEGQEQSSAKAPPPTKDPATNQTAAQGPAKKKAGVAMAKVAPTQRAVASSKCPPPEQAARGREATSPTASGPLPRGNQRVACVASRGPCLSSHFHSGVWESSCRSDEAAWRFSSLWR